jgi:hypothetical protein
MTEALDKRRINVHWLVRHPGRGNSAEGKQLTPNKLMQKMKDGKEKIEAAKEDGKMSLVETADGMALG